MTFTYKKAEFDTLEKMVASIADMLQPPERMRVSEAAAKYRYINNPPAYVGMWSNEKTPYNVEIMDTMTSLDYQGIVLVGPARIGKGLALDTPIPTPTGWKTMGDLREGDVIFGRDGKPCKVLWVSQTNNIDCYKIEFDDGAEIVTDCFHKWEVDDVVSENTKIIDTMHLAATYRGKSRKRYAVKNCGVVEYPTATQFLDPYIFGLWLGDGSTMYGHLTVGAQDKDETKAEIEKRGWQVRVYEPSGEKTAYTFGIRSADGVPIIEHLATMGLGGDKGKFIPDEYIFADEHQRREFIRGLLDTDGSLYGQNGRFVQFSNGNKRISDGAAQILLSLGYKVRTRTRPIFVKGKQFNDTHYVEFTTYEPELVFSMPRKIRVASRGDNAKARPTNTTRRFVSKVTEIPSVPTRCIAVDSEDKLFLAGKNFIPTHNSDLFYNWLLHSVLCDPGDMIFYAMTREVARDISQGDLGKVMRHTEKLGEMLVKGRNNDNTFDKRFRNGMRLLMRWPTITELSGKTLPRVWFADYDRVEDADDIAKEGPMFDLGMKRTTTYKRFGMTVAESSPGRPVENPKFVLSSPHEAPPAKGILGLYNRGDRRRRYWRCLHCRTPFEPSFKLFCYPESNDFMEAAEMVTLRCPHCGYDHTHDTKRELDCNDNARWIQDYVTWHKDGSITGKPRKTNIASFWLKGPCAAFQTWPSLVFNFLQAKAAFDATGDEGPLKKTITTDQGEPYVPKALESGRSPESLMDHARNWGSTAADPTVPEGVHFLIASVDVQAGQRSGFVVQVTGFGKGGDATVIDMFRIRKSERLDEDGERLPVTPESYLEDWDLLQSQVMDKSYALADGSGRRMAIKLTVCDYGGSDGVSVHAREFWRKLHRDNESHRLMLVKGEPSKTAPHVQVKYPDANQKDRYNSARGDVPVAFINSLEVKDMLSGLLGRMQPGGGMWTFPHWAPTWFYSQMTSEVRTEKGWEAPKNHRIRNEAWDLSYYALAALRLPEIRAHRDGFWQSPPPWAAEWDENVLVFGKQEDKPAIRDATKGFDLASLAKILA